MRKLTRRFAYRYDALSYAWRLFEWLIPFILPDHVPKDGNNIPSGRLAGHERIYGLAGCDTTRWLARQTRQP